MSSSTGAVEEAGEQSPSTAVLADAPHDEAASENDRDSASSESEEASSDDEGAEVRLTVAEEVVLREMPLDMLRAIAALLNAQPPTANLAGRNEAENNPEEGGPPPLVPRGTAAPETPQGAEAQLEHLQGLRQALIFMHHRMAAHAAAAHRSNDAMVDGLERLGCVSGARAAAAFRAVDRAEFLRPFIDDDDDDDDEDMPRGPQRPGARRSTLLSSSTIRSSSRAPAAYADAPVHARPLHVSAPSVYGSAVEALELRPGLSFLNVGSGSGYFSAIAAHLLGGEDTGETSDDSLTKGRRYRRSSHHVGLELRPMLVNHARAKFYDRWLRASAASAEHDDDANDDASDDDTGLGPGAEFVEGDYADVDVASSFKFDRIYVGAGARRSARFLFGLLREDGILVGPFEEDDGDSQALVKVVARGGGAYRVGRTRDSSVNFAWLVSDEDPWPYGGPDDDDDDDDTAARRRPTARETKKTTTTRARIRFGGPVWRRHPASQFPASFRNVVRLLARAARKDGTGLVARLPWTDVWDKQILAFVPSDAFEAGPTPPHTCAVCGTVADAQTTFAKCFECGDRYCGKTCQRRAWRDHVRTTCGVSRSRTTPRGGSSSSSSSRRSLRAAASGRDLDDSSSSTRTTTSRGIADDAAGRETAEDEPSHRRGPSDTDTPETPPGAPRGNDERGASLGSPSRAGRARARPRTSSCELRKRLREDNWLWDEDLPPCPATARH